MFHSFQHTAFRLEVRDRYNSEYEAESVRRFLVGEPDDLAWSESWLNMLREAMSAGRSFSRVRVVSVPVSDYSRFGLWASQFTVAVGEDIRYLERNQAEAIGLPHHDYWLFDSRKLVRMHFDDNDAFRGGEVIEDADEIVKHNYWRDAAWHYAVSRDDFANNTSSAANAHQARNALGKRLRELRQQAALSGRQLAESLSWPPSKISKLENGRQTPTDDDIRNWTRATNSEGETEALLASLHTLEVQHAEWQRILRTGLKPRQQELIEWAQKTRTFRVFEATVIPGLLQTPEYARARFAEGVRRLKLPNEINEAVAARMQRQEVLYRPDKRFHFVLTEAA